MLSGALQTAIQETMADAHGIRGWQWTFIINCVMIIRMALIGPFLIPDFPDKPNPLAFWFTKRDYEIARMWLERFRRIGVRPIKLASFKRTFSWPKLYLVCYLYVGMLIAVSGIDYFQLWLKSLVRSDGANVWGITRPNAIPMGGRAMQLVGVWTAAYCCDLFRTRWAVLLAICFVGIPSCIIMSVWDVPTSAKYYAYFILYMLQSHGPPLWAWLSDMCPTDAEQRTLTLGVCITAYYAINAWSNIFIFPAKQAPYYSTSMAGLRTGAAVCRPIPPCLASRHQMHRFRTSRRLVLTTSTLHSTAMSLEDAARAWLAWLSALTLGQIWAALCNPPDKLWKTALFLAAFAWSVPEYWGRFRKWHRGRKRVKYVWPAPKEASPTWHGEVITNPDLFAHKRNPALLPPHASSEFEYITCYDPSSGEHIETRRLPTVEDIARQVARADAAQPKWARTTFAQRASVLRSIKAWILRDMESIVAVACRDTGKTCVDAMFGEVLTTLAKIDWLVKNAEKVLKPERRALSLLLAHKVSEVHYEPLGTVLACVSWNYSFHNALSPILAALMAGDAIVVKCSEQVAWSSDWFIGGVKACLRACGHNADIVQLAVCLPAVAQTLTTNPTIKHVTFIGSEPVGRKVAAAAASNLAGTTIELGGKDPAFILPSADLKFFASLWMRGAFQSAGQNCIGVELFLVPRSRQQEFIDLLLPRVKALRVGVDVGSLISHAPIGRLEKIIQAAQDGGARVLAGGEQYIHPDQPQGAYFAPTLIADVTLDMEIAREELFAPVMTVVPYDDVDEALAKLRGSRFGLGGSVYGAKRKECMHVAKALQCGMVSLNDFGVFYLNQDMPFGGVKASGYGRFAGPEGLRGLCYPKAVIEDRLFSLVRTSIPAPVDFPLPPGDKPWVFLKGLVFFAYGRGMARVKGLFDVVRMAVA